MNNNKLMPLLNETLAQQCADIIYMNIVNMSPGYEPGARLNVLKLAEELGVSETPLKSAIKQLESQGVLTVLPRKGTYVSELSARDVEELLAVRSGIEELAVKISDGRYSEKVLQEMEKCLRRCEFALSQDDSEMYRENDAKFHRLIVAASGNIRLEGLYTYLTASEQIINVYSPRSKNAKEESTKEHWDFRETCKTGELEIILSELRKHWELSRRRVLKGYGLMEGKGEGVRGQNR